MHIAVNHRQLEIIRFFISPLHSEFTNLIGTKASSFIQGHCFRLPNIMDEMNLLQNKGSSVLLKYGVGLNPLIKSRWGTTPLDEAKLRNFDDIIEFFELAIFELNRLNIKFN